MTPDVVVDIGNSRMKWGRCIGGRVAEMVSLRHNDPVAWTRQAEQWGVSRLARWAVAGVAAQAMRRFDDWLPTCEAITATITNKLFADGEWLELMTEVDEPEGIGIDRLLTSVAAFTQVPEETSAIAISVGTAMTVDFVETDGTHLGGAILPGPELMARSLHEHTAKLPEISIDPALPEQFWGGNTKDAIQLGIASAILGAADQLVWDWAEHATVPPWVFVTGGAADYFQGFSFTADVGRVIIDPMLTLEGIRIAAEAMP